MGPGGIPTRAHMRSDAYFLADVENQAFPHSLVQCQLSRVHGVSAWCLFPKSCSKTWGGENILTRSNFCWKIYGRSMRLKTKWKEIPQMTWPHSRLPIVCLPDPGDMSHVLIRWVVTMTLRFCKRVAEFPFFHWNSILPMDLQSNPRLHSRPINSGTHCTYTNSPI